MKQLYRPRKQSRGICILSTAGALCLKNQLFKLYILGTDVLHCSVRDIITPCIQLFDMMHSVVQRPSFCCCLPLLLKLDGNNKEQVASQVSWDLLSNQVV